MTSKRHIGAMILVLSGCAPGLGTSASFPGLKNPVLLGPKDHIGEGAAFPVTKLKDFEGTASNQFDVDQSTSGNVVTTTTTHSWTGPLALSLNAANLTQETPDVDIRIDGVTTCADGWPFGVSGEAYVDVDGSSVRVGGVK